MRWRHGPAVASIVNPTPAKVISCGGGGDDPVSRFTYSDAQWDKIKVVGATGLVLTPTRSSVGSRRSSESSASPGCSRCANVSKSRSASIICTTPSTPRPSRAELMKLRKDEKKWRTSIDNAVSVPLDVKYGVTVSAAARQRRWQHTEGDERILWDAVALPRPSDRAGRIAASQRPKIARDRCWEELLTIWCDLGGEPSDKAAAQFIRAASLPVMASAIPTRRRL